MNKKRRKTKKHTFRNFMIVYAAVLFVAIIGIWLALYSLLDSYEESRPASVMDECIEQLSSGDISGFLKNVNIEASEFERSASSMESYLTEVVSGKELRYSKKSGEYTENNPVYLVYADDNAVAKVTLSECGTNRFNFTLWKLSGLYVGSSLGKNVTSDITITVPKGSVVSVNGIELAASYITEDDIEFDPCKNISEYVDQPLKTTYTVSGLIMEPQVSVTRDGVSLAVECENSAFTAAYPGDDELYASMESEIIELNHAYGKYIINKGSLSSVTSRMTGLAKETMSDIPAVWAYLYGKTYTYEIQNEKITGFEKYSDDCFSCDVYYDLYVSWGDGSVTYDTSLTYTYVKTGGEWVVADFIIN